MYTHAPFTYASIHAIIQEAPTVQEEGLTNKSWYHLLLHMYDLWGTEMWVSKLRDFASHSESDNFWESVF